VNDNARLHDTTNCENSKQMPGHYLLLHSFRSDSLHWSVRIFSIIGFELKCSWSLIFDLPILTGGLILESLKRLFYSNLIPISSSYALGFSKAYQTRSQPESVVVTKVKGVLRTTFSDKELGIPNPEFYRRVWDAADIVIPSFGGEFGGFFVLTNVIITPNQTRGVCAEVSITVSWKTNLLGC